MEQTYEAFEVPFQRDGHFWLQYGLFNRSIGKQDRALELLKKSVDAFPENYYAIHALAQQKLMLAAKVAKHNKPQAQTLMSEAVEHLLILSTSYHQGSNDESAVWTLSKYHIRVLELLGEHDRARAAAREYFEKIDHLLKRIADKKLEGAKNAMLLLATTGKYSDF